MLKGLQWYIWCMLNKSKILQVDGCFFYKKITDVVCSKGEKNYPSIYSKPLTKTGTTK
jgi:hypothetical protein